jgi:hypothetical protein
VLAAVPLGIFELVYFNEPKSTFLGCSVGEYANFHCGDGAWAAIKQIILNIPFGFMLAPPIVIRPSILSPLPPLLIYTHPLMVYLLALSLILVLAIIHIFRMIAWFVVGRWKPRE